MKKILIIIPTYNEIDNLPRMVGKIKALDLNADILVVDDNSPDGTGQWVEDNQQKHPGIFLLKREKKSGLGSAYIAGFKYAIRQGYDLVFEMDADFSHDPKYLPHFLQAIQGHDLVLGSRYITGVNVVNWPLGRLLLSYFANIYARIVTNMPIKDATGGFKCFRIGALKALDLDQISSDGYSFQIEVTYKLWKKNFKIKEIPIIFVDRATGESKMNGKIIREALFVLLKLRFGKGSSQV